MIDLEKLEAQAKVAQSGIPEHRIKFFVNIDPETTIELIAEIRRLREAAMRSHRWMIGYQTLTRDQTAALLADALWPSGEPK
ncbi:hypothetical protein WT25_11065 [Burkholderia territorii]|uniref:hypothetical protein n=1 Tax=Burkholderia territorii TaxID=1503055 RepID=UPI00075B8275|nr:hypothetical protein [Burkholderia territorii]KVT86286.1 hypothetical protein WT25_11065 [Burkholderia territorii]